MAAAAADRTSNITIRLTTGVYNPPPPTDITDPNRYQTDYYFRAWTRAPVYMLGVAFAFLWIDFTSARDAGADHWCVNLFASNRHKRLTAPIAALFGTAFLLLALTAYGAQPAYHDGGLPKFWDVAYLALSRSAWCVGLLLLCFLLFQGFGGAIRALLENRVMAVLSRLTFAAYLVHPALIFLVFQDQQLPIHYSTIWYVRWPCGCMSVGGQLIR